MLTFPASHDIILVNEQEAKVFGAPVLKEKAQLKENPSPPFSHSPLGAPFPSGYLRGTHTL